MPAIGIIKTEKALSKKICFAVFFCLLFDEMMRKAARLL